MYSTSSIAIDTGLIKHNYSADTQDIYISSTKRSEPNTEINGIIATWRTLISLSNVITCSFSPFFPQLLEGIFPQNYKKMAERSNKWLTENTRTHTPLFSPSSDKKDIEIKGIQMLYERLQLSFQGI